MFDDTGGYPNFFVSQIGSDLKVVFSWDFLLPGWNTQAVGHGGVDLKHV